MGRVGVEGREWIKRKGGREFRQEEMKGGREGEKGGEAGGRGQRTGHRQETVS
jgi:hypothetical protein